MMVELPLALSALLILGTLRARVDMSLEETGRASAVTYHGTVTHLVIDGDEVKTARAALGSLDGGGLVTARSRADLMAGRFLQADPSAPWVRPSGVYYTRWRPEYQTALWDHDLDHTEAQLGPLGPVFRTDPDGKPAVACRHLPGEFICDG